MYIIPLLRIQGYYVDVCKNRHVRNIEKMHKEYLLTDDSCYMHISFELERQWYPVILTDSKWLAESVLAYYAKVK